MPIASPHSFRRFLAPDIGPRSPLEDEDELELFNRLRMIAEGYGGGPEVPGPVDGPADPYAGIERFRGQAVGPPRPLVDYYPGELAKFRGQTIGQRPDEYGGPDVTKIPILGALLNILGAPATGDPPGRSLEERVSDFSRAYPPPGPEEPDRFPRVQPGPPTIGPRTGEARRQGFMQELFPSTDPNPFLPTEQRLGRTAVDIAQFAPAPFVDPLVQGGIKLAGRAARPAVEAIIKAANEGWLTPGREVVRGVKPSTVPEDISPQIRRWLQEERGSGRIFPSEESIPEGITVADIMGLPADALPRYVRQLGMKDNANNLAKILQASRGRANALARGELEEADAYKKIFDEKVDDVRQAIINRLQEGPGAYKPVPVTEFLKTEPKPAEVLIEKQRRAGEPEIKFGRDKEPTALALPEELSPGTLTDYILKQSKDVSKLRKQVESQGLLDALRTPRHQWAAIQAALHKPTKETAITYYEDALQRHRVLVTEAVYGREVLPGEAVRVPAAMFDELLERRASILPEAVTDYPDIQQALKEQPAMEVTPKLRGGQLPTVQEAPPTGVGVRVRGRRKGVEPPTLETQPPGELNFTQAEILEGNFPYSHGTWKAKHPGVLLKTGQLEGGVYTAKATVPGGGEIEGRGVGVRNAIADLHSKFVDAQPVTRIGEVAEPTPPASGLPEEPITPEVSIGETVQQRAAREKYLADLEEQAAESKRLREEAPGPTIPPQKPPPGGGQPPRGRRPEEPSGRFPPGDQLGGTPYEAGAREATKSIEGLPPPRGKPPLEENVLGLQDFTSKPLTPAQIIEDQFRRVVPGMANKYEETATAIMDQYKNKSHIISSQGAFISDRIQAEMEVFNVDKSGLIPSLANDEFPRGPGLRDVTDAPASFNLNAEQKAAVEKIRQLVAPYAKLANEVGIEYGSRVGIDPRQGGFYIPRGSASLLGYDEPVRMRPSRGQGTSPYKKPAKFGSEAEGIEKGYEYVSPEESVHSYILWIGRDINRKHMANQFAKAKQNGELVLKKTPPEGVGHGRATVDVPSMAGVDLPTAMANAANHALQQERLPSGMLENVIMNINSLQRLSTATGDDSAIGIQGLLAAAADPKAVPIAVKVHVKSIIDPKALGHFFKNYDIRAKAEGTPTLVQATRNGLHIAGTTGTIAGETGLGQAAKLLEKAPGIKQINRMFTSYSDTIRASWYRDLVLAEIKKGIPLAQLESSGELRRMADSVNRMTGWSQDRAFGGLGDLALYAPRFFQARVETLINGIGGFRPGASAEQIQARDSLVKLFGVATALTVAGNAVQGRKTDFAPVIQNADGSWRYNSNFLALRALGQDWKLLGPYDSILGLIINAATLPTAKDTRGKARRAKDVVKPLLAAVPSLAGNIESIFRDGKDMWGTIYDPNNPIDWARLLGETFKPFSLGTPQDRFTGASEAEQAAGSIPSVFGIKGSAVNASDMMEDVGQGEVLRKYRNAAGVTAEALAEGSTDKAKRIKLFLEADVADRNRTPGEEALWKKFIKDSPLYAKVAISEYKRLRKYLRADSPELNTYLQSYKDELDTFDASKEQAKRSEVHPKPRTGNNWSVETVQDYLADGFAKQWEIDKEFSGPDNITVWGELPPAGRLRIAAYMDKLNTKTIQMYNKKGYTEWRELPGDDKDIVREAVDKETGGLKKPLLR